MPQVTVVVTTKVKCPVSYPEIASYVAEHFEQAFPHPTCNIADALRRLGWDVRIAWNASENWPQHPCPDAMVPMVAQAVQALS